MSSFVGGNDVLFNGFAQDSQRVHSSAIVGNSDRDAISCLLCLDANSSLMRFAREVSFDREFYSMVERIANQVNQRPTE